MCPWLPVQITSGLSRRPSLLLLGSIERLLDVSEGFPYDCSGMNVDCEGSTNLAMELIKGSYS